MRSGDRRGEAVASHVRVDLRGRDVGVAEQGLHAPEICTAFHQMRSKGVAQNMRR